MKYALLEAAVSCGSPFIGTEYAYRAIMPRLLERIGREKLSLYPMEIRMPCEAYPADLIALDTVCAVSEELRTNWLLAVAKGEFPVTIGGDHSVAMGSLAAASETVGSENLALIYLDAHTDINTIESSESHRIHGMDLAEALGLTNPRLSVGKNPKDLYGENIHFIGARSVDEPEWGILAREGCTCHTNEDVRRRGLAAVCDDVIKAVKGKKVALSFDVDVLDPKAFTATGYNIPDGLTPAEVQTLLARFMEELDVISLDCVEYSPAKDPVGRDLDTLLEILGAVIK